MRPLLWSFGIQASGSAATVGAALLVSWRLGLEAQGEFGLLRSWNDALISAAVLGLPQSLLHLQYRQGVPTAALRDWIGRYVAVVAILLALLACGAVMCLPARSSGRPDETTVLVLALVVPLATAHLLCRSLLLREASMIRYALITALPSLLILVGLLPICFTNLHLDFVWALFGSASLSALASAWLVRRALRCHAIQGAHAPWSRHLLWTIGIETGTQNVLAALSPALVLSIVSLRGASLAQVGVVSLVLHVYQLFSVAAAYVAPMVYDRAARANRSIDPWEQFDRLRRQFTWRVSLSCIFVVLLTVTLLDRYWLTIIVSPWLMLLMAVAGATSMLVRLLATLMLARGAFRPLTFLAFGRLALACGVTALLMRAWPPIVAVTIALLLIELLTLAWLMQSMRQPGVPQENAS